VYFTYTGIRVRNLERARRFYRDALGMRVVNRGRMDAGGLFVHLKSPESSQVLELNWYPPRTRFHEPYANGSELDHLAFWCRDVRADFGRLLGKIWSRVVGGAPASADADGEEQDIGPPRRGE